MDNSVKPHYQYGIDVFYHVRHRIQPSVQKYDYQYFDQNNYQSRWWVDSLDAMIVFLFLVHWLLPIDYSNPKEQLNVRPNHNHNSLHLDRSDPKHLADQLIHLFFANPTNIKLALFASELLKLINNIDIIKWYLRYGHDSSVFPDSERGIHNEMWCPRKLDIALPWSFEEVFF